MKDDGTRYDAYLQDMLEVDGTVMYVPDLKKMAKEKDKADALDLKLYILKAVKTMCIHEKGLYFDGNDAATSNIQKAVTGLVADENTSWILYDNSDEIVNKTILRKVLRKAGIVKTKLLFCKSKNEVDDIVAYHTQWMKAFSVEVA